MTTSAYNSSRRRFLKESATIGGGLVVGFHLPHGRFASAAPADASFTPNAFVKISADDTIRILCHHSEMGQGVYTSLPMILAEELDADWNKIEVEAAPVAPEYANPIMGQMVTGGSSSVRTSWKPLREAGAGARHMLVQAAADAWGVAPDTLTTDQSVVIHEASGRRASYGSLVDKAAQLEPPKEVRLKSPSEFKLIGQDVRRIEGADKVTGKAEFGLDVKLEGLLTAVVARPPVCGGTLKKVLNADTVAKMPNVVKVKPISTGVAVIAKDFYSALTARDALELSWDEGANASVSTAALMEDYKKSAETPGKIAEDEGDAMSVLSEGETLEALYEVPYLAHAPMEPLNCTVHVTEEGCDVYAGTQFQSNDQRVAAKHTGLPPEKIRIHTTLLGGGFGRRANFTSDFVSDAVEVANGEPHPVKTIWTREEDIQCGYYRPMFVHKFRGSLKDGKPYAWHQRAVGQRLLPGPPDAIDEVSVEGAIHMPYAIENRRIELHTTSVGIPVLWWRSVGHTHTGFANECFLDELSHAAGRDPFEFRRELLKDAPGELRVLELAAEKADWGKPLPEGRARGIAVRQSFGTYVAEVAEVSVNEKNEIRVHRVTCAVDCGLTINPWNVKAQIESGVVYGLTAALFGELTIENGRVQQSNFHDYRVLRMNEMPTIDVHIIESTEDPQGVGEPGVPPIAPAVGNAVFTLTGKRLRKLPFKI